MFEKLDRIVIPTLSEIRENLKKKHHPVQYTIEQYVNQQKFDENQDWTETSKTLIHLATAEKNYSANNQSGPTIRKLLAIFGTIAGIFAVKAAEEDGPLSRNPFMLIYKDKEHDR